MLTWPKCEGHNASTGQTAIHHNPWWLCKFIIWCWCWYSNPCSHKETSTMLYLYVAATTIAFHHRVIVRTSRFKLYCSSRHLDICGPQTADWWTLNCVWITSAFHSCSSSLTQTEMIRTHTAMLERFKTKHYSVYWVVVAAVDDARLCLFLQKERNFDHKHPSSYVLHQHFLRVAYQSGHILYGVMQSKNLQTIVTYAFKINL